jgi:hypothetical protein
VRRVFRIGGAQAIAAMAYGTESVPRCVKLFGPGNAWVTEAKRQVSSDPRGAAQDMPAGPSEVLVIADDSADATAVCWDLLSQAEHGPDSQVILLSDSKTLLKTVAQQLPGMADALPRSDILASSIGHTRLIQVDGLSRAVAISNQYAPEHLILNCRNAEKLADRVTTAGSVFIGPWTPESLGDYCSGTNHVLPTYGYARAYSGLSWPPAWQLPRALKHTGKRLNTACHGSNPPGTSSDGHCCTGTTGDCRPQTLRIGPQHGCGRWNPAECQRSAMATAGRAGVAKAGSESLSITTTRVPDEAIREALWSAEGKPAGNAGQ